MSDVTESEFCQYEHLFSAIDPAGEVPVICGLLRGHEGEHDDWRAVMRVLRAELSAERAKREEAENDWRNACDVGRRLEVQLAAERTRTAALMTEGEEMDAKWHAEVAALHALLAAERAKREDAEDTWRTLREERVRLLGLVDEATARREEAERERDDAINELCKAGESIGAERARSAALQSVVDVVREELDDWAEERANHVNALQVERAAWVKRRKSIRC